MEAAQNVTVSEPQEGRLTQFATSLDKHNTEIEELSQQLGRFIDRLQGPRPSDDASDEEQQPLQGGIMDRIESTLFDASCGLSSIATKLNQLDEFL